jgi:hypothetical protein
MEVSARSAAAAAEAAREAAEVAARDAEAAAAAAASAKAAGAEPPGEEELSEEAGPHYCVLTICLQRTSVSVPVHTRCLHLPGLTIIPSARRHVTSLVLSLKTLKHSSHPICIL